MDKEYFFSSCDSITTISSIVAWTCANLRFANGKHISASKKRRKYHNDITTTKFSE